MEKRLLLAAALSLGILLAWEWLVPKPRKPATPVPAPAAAAAPTPSAASPAAGATAEATVAPAPPATPGSAAEETTEVVENDLFKATFTNRGAVVKSFILKKYTDEQKQPLELVRTARPDLPRPLGLDFGKDSEMTKSVAAALFLVERESPRALRFRYTDAKISVTKEFRISDGYLFATRISV